VLFLEILAAVVGPLGSYEDLLFACPAGEAASPVAQ
jgi:hypothetical protein